MGATYGGYYKASMTVSALYIVYGKVMKAFLHQHFHVDVWDLHVWQG